MEDVKTILKKLDTILKDSFAKITKRKKIGILFSAGVDSSLIAKYAQDCGLNPALFTFGTDYSKDFAFAQKLACDLKLPFYYLHLSQKEIEEIIPKVKNLLIGARIDPNLMQISLALGFYKIAQFAQPKGITLFLSGQGSDELFGGYNKYIGIKTQELRLKMKKDLANLFKVDMIRDRTMTKQFGLDIYFPYLDKDFINYAQSLPIELKIRNGVRKWILRELAKQKVLPDYIFNRPKNALQYSSGIQKIVEKIRKKTFLPYK